MRPLEGVQVLDLSANIAGPAATLTLSRLGARVIKVERPSGDPSRQWAPFVDGQSVTYDSLNRGKEGIVLNLNDPSDRRLLENLAAASDVFVHNYTPDVLAKLRLRESEVHAMNPHIIYCTVGAFGGGAIGEKMPGYDGVAQAFTGIMEMTGHPGTPPTRCAPAVVDLGTGQWLVIGVLAALMARGRGRPVDTIETTLVDTAIGLVPYQAAEARLTGVRPPRYGSGSPLGAPHEVFATADRPIFVGAPSEHLWRAFALRVLDSPELLDDDRFRSGTDRLDNISELRKEITDRLTTRPAVYWTERLIAAEIPTAEVLGLEEAVVNPIADERRWFEPGHDAGGPLIRLPVLVDGAIVPTSGVAPALGQHTAAVAAEFSDDSERGSERV